MPLVGINAGLLLRRQRGDPRVLRRRHRHRGLEHRHGRPGDDRRRRARRVRARRRSARSSVQVPTAWSTSPSPTRPRRSRSPSSTCRTSRAPVDEWSCADQRELRHVIPENRMRGYDVRAVIDDAVRHRLGARAAPRLRPRDGHRVGPRRGPAGRRRRQQPDAPRRRDRQPTAPTRRPGSCSCATRSTSRCVTLCDTPGIMVGPAVEETALVRHCSRLFVTGANLTVPFVTIVLRKGYGLGAQAMMGGSSKAPLFCVAWPTGEFGGMGLEGAVRLGLPPRARGHRRPRRARAAASRRWSPACTSTARR